MTRDDLTIPARAYQPLVGEWEIMASDLATPPGLDAPGWLPVEVPNQWHLSGLPGHAGVTWYRKHFVAEPAPKDHAPYLTFAGVDYAAEVWELAHDPWRFDIVLHRRRLPINDSKRCDRE